MNLIEPSNPIYPIDNHPNTIAINKSSQEILQRLFDFGPREEGALYGIAHLIDNPLYIKNDKGVLQYGKIDGISGPKVCAQICVYNEECENWACHRYDKLKNSMTEGMPIDLFMGKIENDLVTFYSAGQKIVLKCCIKPKGADVNFEHILYNLTSSFGGMSAFPNLEFYSFRSEECFPPLSQFSQACMFVTNHELYSRSLGLDVKNATTFQYYEPSLFHLVKLVH